MRQHAVPLKATWSPDGVIGAAIGISTFILAGLLLPWLAALLQLHLNVSLL